jgi:hypothetical protein
MTPPRAGRGRDGGKVCPHFLPVRDYLNARGAQYGVGPKPHADRCSVCHGPCTDRQVEDRERWTLSLLLAVDRSKTASLIDKERYLMAGLISRYGRPA